jgi:hypothetical protein
VAVPILVSGVVVPLVKRGVAFSAIWTVPAEEQRSKSFTFRFCLSINDFNLNDTFSGYFLRKEALEFLSKIYDSTLFGRENGN